MAAPYFYVSLSLRKCQGLARSWSPISILLSQPVIPSRKATGGHGDTVSVWPRATGTSPYHNFRTLPQSSLPHPRHYSKTTLVNRFIDMLGYQKLKSTSKPTGLLTHLTLPDDVRAS